MKWIFDAFVIIVMIAAVSINARRGFVKSLLLVVAFLVSVAAASVLSLPASSVIYDKFVSEKVNEQIADQLPEIDAADKINEAVFSEGLGITVDNEEVREAILAEGDMIENLNKLVGNDKTKEITQEDVDEFLDADRFMEEYGDEIPEESREIVKTALENDREDVYGVVRAFAENDEEKRADAVGDALVKPLVMNVIRFVVGLLIFAVVSLILRQVIKLFDLVNKIPVAGTLNTVLGGVLGMFEGVIIVAVAAFAVKFAISLGAGGEFLNIGVIKDTILFRIFYNLF